MNLVCVSHSPMLGNLEQPSPHEKDVVSHFAALRSEIQELDPELIVLFGPDHFNGFFFDLMPSFCIGIKGESVGDYNGVRGPMLIDEAESLSCAHALANSGFDPAVSYKMQVDHGFEQPMRMLLGGIDRRPVVPIFINCIGGPRPSLGRALALGKAAGVWAKDRAKRVLVIGSGGLSHDPPVAALDKAEPEVFQFMVSGRSPSPEARRAREQRTAAAAADFKKGTSPLRPLNEEWDQRILKLFTSQRFDELSALNDEAITNEGGRGGHEIRTWMAAFGMISQAGSVETEVLYYKAIPEWIVGAGMIKARAAA